MLYVRKRPPVDYSKCNQTITIYHKDGDKYSQVTIDNAFLDFKKTQNIEKTGSREATSFLLVIPCAVQPVFIGDKVLLGKGPKVATADDWRSFIPAAVPGLVVVQYVDLKYWLGQLVHVEAGG